MRALHEMTTQELENELHRRLLERTRGCTGVAATWCAVHGDCTCPESPEHEANGYRKSLNDEDCPLHGSRSEHAAGEDAVVAAERSW